MRRTALATAIGVCLVFQVVYGQAPPAVRRAPSEPAPATLPIRRVVVYKNGVAYVEHIGKVQGNQSIALDLTSGQLDDALSSMTVVDLGNGRIGSISYNSQASLDQRLGALHLPEGGQTDMLSFLQALRGARVEVRSPAGTFTGRLLGVERRIPEPDSKTATVDRFTLASDSGDLRTIELTPTTQIRILDKDSANQMNAYLGVLASGRAPDLRRVTIATAGTGERDVVLGYVTETPIWKTSYRLVFPPDGEQPFIQGWAIVDNTSNENWTNVDLSLIAGAPQSFIQQISEPRYVTRAVVQAGQIAPSVPQTHDATLKADSRQETVAVTGEAAARDVLRGSRFGGTAGGYVPAPAAQAARLEVQQPVADSQQLTELFEYHVTAPMNIPRNQSALIPILNAQIDAERVSIWNERTGAQPLHALWLTNTTGLTLDSGSFAVLDSGIFAGEGLLEPIKPMERRLVSYGADVAVRVESRLGDERTTVRRVVIDHGILVQSREQRARRVYTIRNNDTSDRSIVVEHPVRAGWTLAEGMHPDETSPTAYRFKVLAPAGQTTMLTVGETQPSQTTYQVASLTDNQVDVILQGADAQMVRQALAPIFEKKAAISAMEGDVTRRDKEIQQAAADQQRIRENLLAVKASGVDRQLASRYASDLEKSEDHLATLRSEADARRQALETARGELTRTIEALAVDVAMGGGL